VRGKEWLSSLIVFVLIMFTTAVSNVQALTIDINTNWGTGIEVSGTNTLNWSFDLNSFGLDTPGTVINSAVLTVAATGVDTNQDIPPSTQTGTYSSGYNNNYYSGNLSDSLTGEAGSFNTYLARGDGITTVNLLPGLTNYSYLCDGSFDVSLSARETDLWGTDYFYSSTRQTGGGYYISHLFWREWVPYTYATDYYSYHSPIYDGSLTLTNSNLTIDYTPAPVPIPAAVWLFGTGLLGLWGIRRKR